MHVHVHRLSLFFAGKCCGQQPYPPLLQLGILVPSVDQVEHDVVREGAVPSFRASLGIHLVASS